MRIISYFCIVKQIKSSFKIVFAAFLSLFWINTNAQYSPFIEEALSAMDSIEISLLTCGPGDEVYSYYGHTAIRYHDLRKGSDLAINYGVFSFEQEYFIPRFVFGITDYEMGIFPMDLILKEYQYDNRWIIQQDLSLTNQEKLLISRDIYENYQPQNRIYRYNYFYDNCTTRARDILLKHLNAEVENGIVPENGNSYRSMIHQWTENHPWARFGNDLLLGIKADFPTSISAKEFLPDSLRNLFDKLVIKENGTSRRLVKNKFFLLPPQKLNKETTLTESFWWKITPRIAMGLVLLLTVIITLIEIKTKRIYWLVDLLLLLTTGVAGIVLLLMVFSQHPTVSVNLQILILNPLSLFFLYPVVKAARRHVLHVYWKILLAFDIIFLIGGLFQCYAEGMYFIALAILIRCMVYILRNPTLSSYGIGFFVRG